MSTRKRQQLGVDCEQCGSDCLLMHLDDPKAPASLKARGPICPECEEDDDAFEEYMDFYCARPAGGEAPEAGNG